MDAQVREISDLELEQRCRHCKRTPLVGEHVYLDEREAIVCELCRQLEGDVQLRARLVHGPAFGHAIRVMDRRAR